MYPTSGHLNMTTVSQRDGLTLGQALVLWMSGREQLVPRDLVYPPDKSRDEVDKANNADFQQSEDSAEYAALGYLKYPMAVTVESVNEDGPVTGQAAGRRRDRRGQRHAGSQRSRSSPSLLKDTKPGRHVVAGLPPQERAGRASPPSRWASTPIATRATSASACSTRRGRRSPSTSTWPTSAARPPG